MSLACDSGKIFQGVAIIQHNSAKLHCVLAFVLASGNYEWNELTQDKYVVVSDGSVNSALNKHVFCKWNNMDFFAGNNFMCQQCFHNIFHQWMLRSSMWTQLQNAQWCITGWVKHQTQVVSCSRMVSCCVPLCLSRENKGTIVTKVIWHRHKSLFYSTDVCVSVSLPSILGDQVLMHHASMFWALPSRILAASSCQIVVNYRAQLFFPGCALVLEIFPFWQLSGSYCGGTQEKVNRNVRKSCKWLTLDRCGMQWTGNRSVNTPANLWFRTYFIKLVICPQSIHYRYLIIIPPCLGISSKVCSFFCGKRKCISQFLMSTTKEKIVHWNSLLVVVLRGYLYLFEVFSHKKWADNCRVPMVSADISPNW